MPLPVSRRALLTALAALGVERGLAAAFGARALAQGGPLASLADEPSIPFSFDTLIADARAAARVPFRPAATPSPEVLDAIDYDAHWQISYRDDAAPVVGPYPVEFFHLGKYAREPVDMYLLDDGMAQRFPYKPELFDMPADSPAHELREGSGFAGFRLMRPGPEPDFIAFLGASYFRTDGPQMQYGLSTRGLAVNVGTAGDEEFPRFTTFYIGPAERAGEEAVVYAAMDSKSVTGAYRIGVHYEEGAQRSTVDAHIFIRAPVERLGIAPLTSMFWYSELNSRVGTDWRPEIHDSDGLVIWTGGGERLWRPLTNPRRVIVASFVDPNVQGFGLSQRDREFENYQDDGVFYDRRASVWVTPTTPFGPGAVQLLSIPTTDETSDNVVAYFNPDGPLGAGDERSFSYTIDWVRRDPLPFEMASVVATRKGIGGNPGLKVPPKDTTAYVIDFAGGRLGEIEAAELDVTASGGTVSRVSARPVVGTDRWRGMFDLTVDPRTPVELRAFLRDAGGPLSETWTFLAEG